MTAKYYAILTNQGAARLANATALGTKLNLTQMAVGDAKGTLPAPDPSQTALINQKRIAPINLLTIDPANPSQIIIEQIIPEDEGGWWIREIGLYDSDGMLIAVANCPETYKPQLQEGSGRTQTIRMILIVSNTAAVTLKIDPSVVLATRKYVDDKVIEVKAYADNLMDDHLHSENPHPQYVLIASLLSQIIAADSVEALLASLGIKSAALRDVGTGAKQIPDMSAYTSGKGWCRFPNGMTILRGSVGFQVGVNNQYVTLPRALSSADYHVVCTWNDIGTTQSGSASQASADIGVGANTKTTTRFGMWQGGSGGFNVDYIVVGES